MKRKALSLMDLPLVALLLALFLYPFLKPAQTDDPVLVIEAPGGLLLEPLLPDRTLKTSGPLGETLVEVRDGRARIAESPCQGRLCVRAGWTGKDGVPVVCAPNRVTVYVRNERGERGGPDAILH